MLNENAFIFDKKRIINMNIMIELTTANFFSKQKVGKFGTMYIKCTFLSNEIVQKISFSLCFWASDHLIDKSN